LSNNSDVAGRGVTLGILAIRAHASGDPQLLIQLINAASPDERGWAIWWMAGAVEQTALWATGDDLPTARERLLAATANLDDAQLQSLEVVIREAAEDLDGEQP